MKKFLYGFLFTVIFPVLQYFWANKLSGILDFAQLPVDAGIAFTLGTSLIITGVTIILSGWFALYKYGNGLPMNAFPPEKYVAVGVYKVFPHPVYTGYCIIIAGFGVLTTDAIVLYCVLPVTIALCTALLWGYEIPDLRKRFENPVSQSLFSLPPEDSSAPAFSKKLAAVVLVYLPWLLLYEFFIIFGQSLHPVSLPFTLEHSVPFLPITEIFYGGTYLIAVATPLLIKTNLRLRSFIISGMTATILGILVFIAVPVEIPPYLHGTETALLKIIDYERHADATTAALPSFHFIWAVLCCYALYKERILSKLAASVIAFSIGFSCISLRMHLIIDIIAALPIAFISIYHNQAWKFILKMTELVANSWKEWRVGKIRIINHGMYVGSASFFSVLIMCYLLPENYTVAVFIIAVATIAGAGLWAQVVEGSSRLLRPYGYYGGVFGSIVAGILLSVFNAELSLWLMLAASATAGTIAQFLGRLRCLVQGCCHGDLCKEENGIRYNHPKSRVSKVTALKGNPVYPTPLYSMLWNIICFIVLLRLWLSAAPAPFIFGMYLILNSAGRFIEEKYRGEPQTKVFAGLRLYQWISIVLIISGMFFTVVSANPFSANAHFKMSSLLPAIVAGIFTFFAQGVDFPGSNKRFSRLAD